MPVLRFIAVALLVSSPIAVLGMRAVAEPLDKASCASLANERKKLFTPNMQAALDRGPDWVKDHLNDQELEQVRQFLDVEAQDRLPLPRRRRRQEDDGGSRRPYARQHRRHAASRPQARSRANLDPR